MTGDGIIMSVFRVKKFLKKTASLVFLIFCIFTFVEMFADSFFVPVHKTYFDDNPYVNFGIAWKTEKGTPTDLRDFHTLLSHGEGNNGTVFIHHLVPTSSKMDRCLNFKSKNIYFKVYIDDTQIYDFQPRTPRVLGKSYGICFHSIPILPEYSNHTMTIQVLPIYKDNSCFLDKMVLSSRSLYMQHFYQKVFPDFIICLMIVMMGFVILALAASIPSSVEDRIGICQLALLAFEIGIWTMMDTGYLQMLIGISDLFQGLNYLILYIAPYTAVQFTSAITQSTNSMVKRASAISTYAVFLTCWILNNLAVYDYHETLYVLHLNILLNIILLLVIVVRYTASEWRSRRVRERILMYAGFFTLIFAVVATLVLYAADHRSIQDISCILRYVMMIFTLMMVMQYFVIIAERMKVVGRAEGYQKLAYTDVMTGIPNRAAFLRDENSYKKILQKGNRDSYGGIVFWSIDLNHLKYVNDTFGHAQGDAYIQEAGQLIEQVFKPYGTTYRIGGDEFAVFMEIKGEQMRNVISRCETELEERAGAISEKLKSRVPENLKDQFIPLSIAAGYAYAVECDDLNVEKMEKLADKRMYRKKTEMKANRTD